MTARSWRGMLVAVALAASACFGGETEPRWLAVEGFKTGDVLTRSFTVPAARSARLRFAAEFCRARVALNGRPVLDVEPFCQTQTLDVTDALRSGENRLEIAARPLPDAPAAVALTLSLTTAKGVSSIATNGDWRMVAGLGGKAAPGRPIGTVPPELWGIDRRDIAIDPFENYEQWQQAKGGGGASPRFFVAPGFEIAQLKPAGPDEGSWVSLAVDDRGRLTIAREDKGFLRMTLSDDGGSVARVQSIDSDLLECRGLAYRDGRLYASANNSKKIVRFKLDEDGRTTDLETLREFPGGVGHGRNDVAVRGDALYLIAGDSVDPPTEAILDHTSPLRRKLAGAFRNEGSLLRASLDGRRWELLCAGLRNPYGVALHPETGDPFTYDADNEYDLGMPWYRPTRILQLQTGGDYGYRNASGRIPPRYADQPDNAPPLIDIGRGSPTAVIFGSDFKFPKPYRDALFVLDWTYGRVIAVHLAPRGAGYRAATELFLQGKPLNVTDVAAGRDGSMYLITGGRKTRSALYRVVAKTTAPTTPTEPGEFQTRSRELSSQRREHVRRLRSSNGDAPPDLKSILAALGDPDPVVSHAARTALERRPESEWIPAILGRGDADVPLQGLLAVARTLDPSRVPAILKRLAAPSPKDASIGRRMIWLRILELCFEANRAAVVAEAPALERSVVEGWEASRSPSLQVAVEGTNADYRRRAALLLAKFDSASVPKLVDADLLASPVQEDRLAALTAFRNHRAGWTADIRKRRLETLAAVPSMVGGEGLPAFHAWLERESLADASPEERAYHADRKAAESKPEPLPPPRPLVRKWTIDELKTIVDDPATGDAKRGAAVFRDALCARCHRFGPRGPWIGPDLTFVAGRFGRRDLLDSIVDPSKSVAENYRAEIVETADGKVVSGRPASGGDFRSETLRFIPDLLRPDLVVEIDKKSIEAHRQSDRSPMPEGLLDTFTREEIADLLAYLTAGPPGR